jgi:arylsulfatase A-like enzyme
MRRVLMSRLWPGVVLSMVSSLGLPLLEACGGDSSASGGSGSANGPRPAQAADLRMQQDLLEISHLADVDHHGLFIELGGPARLKYTMGNWGSGWGRDGADGDVPFTYVGEMGRLFFPLREARDLTLRLHIKPIGSHRMQVFVNGNSLEGVVLQEGAQFRDYDVRVPAAQLRAGENYLQLRFGGTTAVDGQNVAVALSSIRVIAGEPPADAGFTPPLHDTLVRAITLGGVERQALALRGPTTVTYHLEVPSSARLVFGLGAEGQATGLGARVRVTPEGGQPSEVFQAAPTASWNDQAVDLSAHAGKVVRLEFEGTGQGSGRVLFSAPAVMVTPPEVAARPEEVRNVVVLLIDTMRASKLRPYNPQTRVRTPILDRVAEQGVVFEQAQAPENWTKPSCASVLTGLSPITHGAKTDEARLPASAELVSEAFDRAGFATGSFIANGYVSDRFGFNQGWDSYNNFIRDGRSTEAEDVFEQAGNFIEAHRNERFFTYIQTIDPHVPYDPPAEYLRMYDPNEYAGPVQPRQTPELLERAKRNEVTFDANDRRRLEALHDGEVSYHDHYLGVFLERLRRLGLMENTLLVITADHGEEFMEHGSWGHGHSIFQELLGVPLIFHMPGRIPAGRRVTHTVSTLNVGQTILDLTGVQGLARAEGRSLVPDLLGDVAQGPQVAFSDFQDIRRVARAGRYKLVVRSNLSSVIFDLQDDPSERREREVSELPIAGRYTRILLGQYLGAQNRAQWLRARQDATAALEAEQAEMDDTIRAQLRALGYAN